jgi:hypothetical protein
MEWIKSCWSTAIEVIIIIIIKKEELEKQGNAWAIHTEYR